MRIFQPMANSNDDHFGRSVDSDDDQIEWGVRNSDVQSMVKLDECVLTNRRVRQRHMTGIEKLADGK